MTAAYHISLNPESMEGHFDLVLLLYLAALNILTFRMQISNLSKCNFNCISFEHAILLIPIVVQKTCKTKLERITLEPVAAYLSLVALLMVFYGH